MFKYKKQIFLITYTLLLFFILWRFNGVTNLVKDFIILVGPFIYGFALAYLINIPATFFLDKVFKAKVEDKNYGKKKGLSILIAYVLAFLIICLIFATLIPQLIHSITGFINNMDVYSKQFEQLTHQVLSKVEVQESIWNQIQAFLIQSKDQIINILQNLVPSLVSFVTTAFNSVFNTIFTLIISIYILLSKEDLKGLIRKSVQAVLPEKTVNYLKHVLCITNETFRGFIVGQLTDALIVGIITFIGALIFKFPYPVLVGFIAGITNVIPVLGPFIGAVPCFVIILLADPTKALWYLVFVVVLQQVDGNIICPKVVGDSIGLDGIFVVFVVLVFGGMFGIIGSILGVPVFAIVFKLYNEWVDNKIKIKEKSKLQKKQTT